MHFFLLHTVCICKTFIFENFYMFKPVAPLRRFSMNVWPGTMANRLTGPDIFPYHLAKENILELLTNGFQNVFDKFPLGVISNMYVVTNGWYAKLTFGISEKLV
jgi:hypothetical protein